jgi:hypothetical protein
MDDNEYFMERQAFREFVENPITDHTLALLRFAMKPFLMRFLIYSRIPPEKWTPDVQRLLFKHLLTHEREIIFLPLLESLIPLFKRFIKRRPYAFFNTYNHLRTGTARAALSEEQQAVRLTLLSAYKKHFKKNPPQTDVFRQLARRRKRHLSLTNKIKK